jgi:hypothetical protein
MSQQTFDPNAPEGEDRAGSAYISRKDIKVIAIGLVALGIICTPIYLSMLENSKKARCTQNMKAIMDALNLYASEHDSRYPPLARTEGIESLVPAVDNRGLVYTWASDVAPYFNQRASFKCPSATDEEAVKVDDPRDPKSRILLTYGMYAPYGAYPTALIENPDTAIIIGETSNQGSNESYNPMPLSGEDGTPRPDGFVIGWDNSNDKFVTRLALPKTKKGVFEELGLTRHPKGIHVLTATGEKLTVTPNSAAMKLSGSPNPFWRYPTGVRRSR